MQSHFNERVAMFRVSRLALCVIALGALTVGSTSGVAAAEANATLKIEGALQSETAFDVELSYTCAKGAEYASILVSAEQKLGNDETVDGSKKATDKLECDGRSHTIYVEDLEPADGRWDENGATTFRAAMTSKDKNEEPVMAEYER
ncbi:hypothetical protein [Nocardia brasiliensis]|uniref:hypothetical protein n=2 Tax=Nocardia brasiliensis TaxID=37326 RepID=UPI0024574226|nr:hypothetical protein [Nocardia brasiliensis]